MKLSLLSVSLVFVLGIPIGGCAQATTITFTGHTANSDVTDKDDGGYGSHVAEETLDFITSDGTGATPNIALLWETATGPNADVWEFHDSATFSLLDPGTTGDRPRPTGVAQLDVNIQNGIPPADPTITFVPDLGYAVTIHSFNIGHATDLQAHEGINSWKITLSRVSDKKVVWSHTTEVLKAGDFETVKVGFTGEPGEKYRLRFDRGVVNHPRAGIDNLSFSQSERQPLTREQLDKATKTLQTRVEKVEQELAEAKLAHERLDKAAVAATQSVEEASEDDVDIAEARAADALGRASRAEQSVTELTRQLESAKAELTKLKEEQQAAGKVENDNPVATEQDQPDSTEQEQGG